jgi:hypothetical protein
MSHHANIHISGKGYQIYAYMISQETLKEIRQGIADEIPFEETPLENLMEHAIDYHIITSGLSIEHPDVKCHVDIDGKIHNIDKIGIWQTGTDFEECFENERNKILVAKEEKILRMGENFKIDKDSIIIIESIEIKKINYRAMISDQDEIRIENIEAILFDLDSCTPLSELTYEKGLLSGLENDLSHFIYKNEDINIEVEIISSYGSHFYLIYNENGNWVDEHIF